VDTRRRLRDHRIVRPVSGPQNSQNDLVSDQTAKDLALRAANTLSELRKHGLHLAGGSRYHRYASELRHASESSGRITPERLAIWHRAVIELYDLEAAVRVLATPPEVEGWRRIVQETLSGGVRRTDEVRHSRSRDIQFEVAVATLLRESGFNVMFAEPDVVARRGDREIAFAVKRPRSRAKVVSNVKAAGQQMVKSMKSGLIALDITCVTSLADRTIACGDAETYRLLADVAGNFGSRNALTLARMVHTENTCGLLVHVALPVANARDGTLGHIRSWSVTSLVEDSDPRTRLLKGLAQRIARGAAG
jgi:hypothetical protein